MAQLNINMTPQFEKALGRFMRIRRIKSKSEAVRVAVSEGLQRGIEENGVCDFADWLGLGLKAPQNPEPRFRSHDDLWR